MAHAGVDAILIPYPSHARYITLDRPSLLVQSNSKPSTATTTGLTSRPSTTNTINHQHTSEHSTNHQPTCTRTLDAHPTGKPASSKPNSPRRTCEHILPPTRSSIVLVKWMTNFTTDMTVTLLSQTMETWKAKERPSP